MAGKKPIVFFLPVFLIFAIAAALVLFKLYLETRVFSPQGSGPVNTDITAIRDGTVDMYLLKKNGKYLAVDAGTDRKNILRQLKLNEIGPEKVSAVLLTHTDFDHTASVPLFANATVYISEPEENMINGKVKRMFFSRNILDVKHRLLKDAETVNIEGWDVRTIILPGHTIGSAAYLIDGKYLFTGDTGIKDGKISAFNAFFCMDQKQQIQSLKKLDALKNLELTLTAHYGIIR